MAVCPENALIESGIDSVVVASIVTWDRPMGVVVPKDDGVDVPLTAPAKTAKGVDEISCLGERVWNVALSDDTST